MRWALILALCGSAFGQNWSTFLDSSRAIDWTNAGIGFTIPSYSVPCVTQPSLTAGSGNAAANATSINNAIASCDNTHNVVSVPSGTWFSANIRMVKSNVVLRGAGPGSSTLILTSGCGGSEDAGICMEDLNDGLHAYNGSASVLPAGAQQCTWTAGFSQGTTSITLSNCGGAPVNNHMLILDQADDLSDGGGVYTCQANATSNCGYEAAGGGSGNVPGRNFGGHAHSQQQITFATSVTSLGGGSYTVVISPGVIFPNIRIGQVPGAWWGGQIQNVGLENINVTSKNLVGGFGSQNYNVNMYDCYHCWMKNVISQWALRGHVMWMQAGFDQIRDSYFYQSQDHASQSYVVEFEAASANLVENNLFQQVTNPLMFGTGAGNVIGYNYAVNDINSANPNYLTGAFSVHNAGNAMNLFEGNNFPSIQADDAFGSGASQTYFRNQLRGWQSPAIASTIPIMIRSNNRAWNVIGNVLGQPSYHTQYQAIATSTSAGTGAGAEDTSIYSLGWGNTGAVCSPITCDPIVGTALMRLGNWDSVNNALRWNATEAAPGAIQFLNANFTSGYFTTNFNGSQPLPASLYYNSQPSWWPVKNWPPIGPGVSGGNVGVCSGGSFPGAQATSSAQCTGGSKATVYASLATSLPAQDCYLSLGGPPDGTGTVLAFDATVCYAAGGGGGGGGASGSISGSSGGTISGASGGVIK